MLMACRFDAMQSAGARREQTPAFNQNVSAACKLLTAAALNWMR